MAARSRATKARSAKKRATRKKTTRRKPARRRRSGLGVADLPRSLREFQRRMRSNLNRLEREVQQTRTFYRRRATRLLRDASRHLGRLETLGERGWRELNTRARREVAALLRRLERAVAPPPVRRAPRRKA